MNKEETFSKTRIAKIFGLTTRSVEHLVENGIIEPISTSPMKFDWEAVTAYIRYLSDKANGREKKKTDQESESAKLEAEARLKQAKAEMAEMELKELQGELHRAEDVEAIMTNHVFAVRSMLMTLPSRLAVDTANAKTKAEAAEIIKKGVYDVLMRLSDLAYDKTEYKKLARERRGWDEDDDE